MAAKNLRAYSKANHPDVREHRLRCKNKRCLTETDKLSRNNNGDAVAAEHKCFACGSDIECLKFFNGGGAPRVYVDNGPWIDSQLQKPFGSKNAMNESIKRRGLELAS